MSFSLVVADPASGQVGVTAMTAMAGVDVDRYPAPGGVGQRALLGHWLGHAAHPMLTDFTAGPWMAASFLDLFGPPRSEDAARRLVGLGLLAAVPTLLSGAAEARRHPRAPAHLVRRHAIGSSLAVALYAGSYLARRRGHHRAGVVLGLLGGVTEVVDGWAGGELTLTHRVGTGPRPT